MHISNSEELIALFKESLEPSEEEKQAAEEARQAQLSMQQSQTNAFQGQANESNARAKKAETEAALLPQKAEIEKIEAITRNLGDAEDKEFDKRIKIADTLLKERNVAVQEEQNLIKAVK